MHSNEECIILGQSEVSTR